MVESIDGRVVVTGGCGFLGSHLTKRLLEKEREVTVLDDLSSGSRRNIVHLLKGAHRSHLRLAVGDCGRPSDVRKVLRGASVVFHLAASPEVRAGLRNPATSFDRNIFATYVLLEEIRRCGVETVVFPSTSSVYGEARLMPTPENYSPLEPISMYAASKLSGEALVSSYAHTYDKRALILRFANIVGSRSRHGVVVDFVKKLRSNPTVLNILGDGQQRKSYIHVKDCISGTFHALDGLDKTVGVFNVGSHDQISVRRIGQIVVEEMGLEGVEYTFSKGANGGGWVGDVRSMLLDTEKLRSKGWACLHDSEAAVRLAVRELGVRKDVSAEVVA